MAALRLLSVSINRRRMAYVFLIGNQLKEWRTMTKPTKSSENADSALRDLINEFKPDVVITEKLPRHTNNTDHVSQLKSAIIQVAETSGLLNIITDRSRDYANKYEEAESLSKFFPEIRPWVPEKRRFFDHEPAHLVLFDALSLAFKVLKRPSEQMAAAMG